MKFEFPEAKLMSSNTEIPASVTTSAKAAQGHKNAASMKSQQISSSSNPFSASRTANPSRESPSVDLITESRTDDCKDKVKPADDTINPQPDSGATKTRSVVGARAPAVASVSVDASVDTVPDNIPVSISPKIEEDEKKDGSAVHSKNIELSSSHK